MRSRPWVRMRTSRFWRRAPYLIAVFQQRYGEAVDGSRVKHYYAPESVGIATGILVTALHHAGLACLTHTPSPMGFLNQILGRAESRTSVCPVSGGVSGDRCEGAGYSEENLGRDRQLLIAGYQLLVIGAWQASGTVSALSLDAS